jgi:DNA-binding LacI/PurR family transcriptional regulator
MPSLKKISSTAAIKAVTMKDIAREAGLTKSAVSMIVNGKGKFNEETVSRVKKIIDRLGYVPHAAASRLARGGTSLIGLLVPNIGENFTVEILRGVEKGLVDSGYDLVLYNTINSENREAELYHRIASSRQVDGIIIQMFNRSAEHIRQYCRYPLPSVLLETNTDKLNCVYLDNFEGAFKATEHLIKKNRRQILLVYGTLPSTVMDERRAGYLAALKKHRIKPNARLQLTIEFSTREMREKEIRPLAPFDNMKPLPFDAVFCAAGDEVASVIAADVLRQRYRIPQDVALVGYDDQPIAQTIFPMLTTVRQPIQKMAAAAVETLLAHIKKPASPLKQRAFETELILRDST